LHVIGCAAGKYYGTVDDRFAPMDPFMMALHMLYLFVLTPLALLLIMCILNAARLRVYLQTLFAWGYMILTESALLFCSSLIGFVLFI
jgi:hypothetical protein